MARIPLSNTGDWKLKFEEQDVRGYDALDGNGNKVGEVDSMIVDTAEKRVDAIVLDDGTEYPARDLSIGDGVVYLSAEAPQDVRSSVTVYDDYGHVEQREGVSSPDYDQHADAFRSYHTETYGDSGQTYESHEPAYRYGYESAHSDENRHRSFTDAETELEQGYRSRNPEGDYASHRESIRYGYRRAQRGR